MVTNCDEVLRDLSDYLDGTLEPVRSAALKQHFVECSRCRSVVEGIRNVIALYGDERMQAVPFGYEQRLHRRIEGTMHHANGSFFGWLVAAAATVLILGSFELASSSAVPALRSQHSHPAGQSIPGDRMVVVAQNGKTFHVAGCRFIHENDKAKVRTIPAHQATQEGYVPCIRCMGEYLSQLEVSRRDHDEVADAEPHPSR